MTERPDSALYILKNIDTAILKSTADKALHALLCVQAEDKNYIDSKDVSKIQTAVNFYKDSKDEYHKMLSYYYLARIEENAQEYSKAIINLLEAEEVAENINNQFYLGLIYRSCSNIYDKIYNNVESLNYAKRSYDSFKETKCLNYEFWALWRLGCAYHNTNDYNQCIAIMSQVADGAQTNGDMPLYVESLKSKALSHLALHEYDEVLRIYDALQKIPDFEMGTDDFQNLGLACVGTGDDDHAGFYMNQVMLSDSSRQLLPYEINKKLGKYDAALIALENEYAFQDSILYNVITQNVTQMVSDYHNYAAELHESELQHERRMTFVIISVIILLVAFASILIIQRIKTQKKEIENNMLKASNLRHLLQIKETEAIAMNEAMVSKDAESQSLNVAINKLFEQHFATIDKLTSAYYEYQGTINEKHRIYCDVMNIMLGFRSNRKVINELEKFVNQYRNNLMTRFHANFPEFKEADCVLFLYITAGFSSRAISVFINEKLDIVYNRKSRLKQKISRSSSPEKEVFAQYMR